MAAFESFQLPSYTGQQHLCYTELFAQLDQRDPLIKLANVFDSGSRGQQCWLANDYCLRSICHDPQALNGRIQIVQQADPKIACLQPAKQTSCSSIPTCIGTSSQRQKQNLFHARTPCFMRFVKALTTNAMNTAIKYPSSRPKTSHSRGCGLCLVLQADSSINSEQTT